MTTKLRLTISCLIISELSLFKHIISIWVKLSKLPHHLIISALKSIFIVIIHTFSSMLSLSGGKNLGLQMCLLFVSCDYFLNNQHGHCGWKLAFWHHLHHTYISSCASPLVNEKLYISVDTDNMQSENSSDVKTLQNVKHLHNPLRSSVWISPLLNSDVKLAQGLLLSLTETIHSSLDPQSDCVCAPLKLVKVWLQGC